MRKEKEAEFKDQWNLETDVLVLELYLQIGPRKWDLISDIIGVSRILNFLFSRNRM